MHRPWKRSEKERQMTVLGLLTMIAVGLTIVAMALPVADSMLADPTSRFGLIVAVLALLGVLLVRALHPQKEVRYAEFDELGETVPVITDVREGDWLTLFLELRTAARRRLEVRHRMTREEVERVLYSAKSEELVKDWKVLELLTCDLKVRYTRQEADPEATFVDLLGRVEAME